MRAHIGTSGSGHKFINYAVLYCEHAANMCLLNSLLHNYYLMYIMCCISTSLKKLSEYFRTKRSIHIDEKLGVTQIEEIYIPLQEPNWVLVFT